MIISKIFDIKINQNLTKHDLENFFERKKINPVKWAVVKILGNEAKILTAFEKKTL